MSLTARIDSKGRLIIPQKIRTELDLQEGDTISFMKKGNVIQITKSPNPFDVLGDHAKKERAAGRVKTLEEFAKEQGIELESE